MTVTEDTEMEQTSPKLTERWQRRVRKSTDRQKKKENQGIKHPRRDET